MPCDNADTAMDRDFLGIRCRLIELAAAFDRIDRAGPSNPSDARRSQILRAVDVLASDASDRAERIQGIFSLPSNMGSAAP